jgi:hypothetical protein
VAYSDTSFLSCATGVILSFAKFQNDALWLEMDHRL